ncbi:MAG TPA: class I SAM-dependent methyltransferase [Candidatus Limnocylindrales bacterium]|nr:class I SAM-dependent methyltransferase [Candidatus Limnocylindrales bacterium]
MRDRTRRGLLEIYRRRIAVEGAVPAIARALRHPDRTARHVIRLVRGDPLGLSNRYRASSRLAGIELVAQATGRPAAVADALFREAEAEQILGELRLRYRETRPEWADTFDLGRFKILYALVRLLGPGVVVETGVHDGLSTALILRALDRNRHGALTSIDLPSTDLPLGVDGPGWLVAHEYRHRWRLLLGDSRKVLPNAVARLAPIDLFLHDSDHSRSHREFEFRTVRPFMAPSGLIVSDDDEPGDGLLDELASEWELDHLSTARPGSTGPHVGLLARPQPVEARTRISCAATGRPSARPSAR